MKSLKTIKDTFSTVIKKQKQGKASFPRPLKIAVGELYNAEKFSSTEIAEALKLTNRQVTTWGRRLRGGLYNVKTKKAQTKKVKTKKVKSKGPIRSKKIKEKTTEALFNEEASWEDIQKIGAGLIYEILQISKFIEGEIDSLEPKKGRG